MPYDPDQTRLRIVQAGAELFYGKSIAEVGVDAVAERAGITKKTLYYHFENKTSLVEASFARRTSDVLARYSTLISQASSAKKAIEALFDSAGQFARLPTTKGCPFIRAAAELAAKDDHPAIGVIREYKRALATLIKGKLIDDGYVHPGRLTRQIMVLYEGAITNVMFHDDPTYIEDASAAAKVLLTNCDDE